MRAYFLDRVRVILTVLVIAYHSAVTYGANGSWFLKLAPPDDGPGFLLTLFAATNHAFLAGFFFLIAGYLTPSSYDRNGWRAYTRGRLLRLGLPTVFFGFVLGPLTYAIANDGANFAGLWLSMMGHLRFVMGPMWLAYALLLFTLAYVLWRRMVAVSPGARKPIPSHRLWILGAVAVGAISLLIRQVVPAGNLALNLPLGYLPAYVLLFVLGCIAERHGWVEKVKRRHALPWITALILALLLLPTVIYIGGGFSESDTGFSPLAIFRAFWEPVVAWGVIAGALWLIALRMRRRNRRWGFVSRQSYAALIIHPPVIVTLALLMEPLPIAVLVKFLLLTALGTAVSVALGWAIRKIPKVGKVI